VQKPARTPLEEAFDAMERFADDMCSCADAACAQGVANDMSQWAQDEAKAGSTPPKMSDEDNQRAVEIARRLSSCMQKAMSQPAPSQGTP
jgi:hypothetical protein